MMHETERTTRMTANIEQGDQSQLPPCNANTNGLSMGYIRTTRLKKKIKRTASPWNRRAIGFQSSERSIMLIHWCPRLAWDCGIGSIAILDSQRLLNRITQQKKTWNVTGSTFLYNSTAGFQWGDGILLEISFEICFPKGVQSISLSFQVLCGGDKLSISCFCLCFRCISFGFKLSRTMVTTSIIMKDWRIYQSFGKTCLVNGLFDFIWRKIGLNSVSLHRSKMSCTVKSQIREDHIEIAIIKRCPNVI